MRLLPHCFIKLARHNAKNSYPFNKNKFQPDNQFIEFAKIALGISSLSLGSYCIWKTLANFNTTQIIQEENQDNTKFIQYSNIVIIGAGLAGLACGVHLDDEVTIVEREEPGAISQASVLNTGMVLPYSKGGIWQSLGIATLNYLKKMHESGEDIDFNLCGSLLVAETENQMHELRKLKLGPQSKLIESQELHKIEPHLSSKLKGAILTENEASVNPIKVVHVLEKQFLKNPKHVIKKNHEVREIIIEPSGWLIKGVRLEHRADVEGEPFAIKTPNLVVACGPMGAFFGEQLGIELPIIPVAGNVFCSEPTPNKVKRMIFACESHQYWKKHPTEDYSTVPPCVTHKSMSGERLTRHLYCKQLSDGRFIAGGDRRVHPQQAPMLAHALPRAFPEEKSHKKDFNNSPAVLNSFAFTKKLIPSLTVVQKAWGGVMSFTSDGMPILGKVDNSYLPKETTGELYLVLGFGPKGMSTAIEGGRRVAEQIKGNTVNLKGAEPQRFFS